jgi:hypothetical protein
MGGYSPLGWLVPRISIRSVAFTGPVTLATALLLASSITPPTYQGFNVVSFSDPTFAGKIGIWGVCQGYKTDNATTANPNATLTGNSTYDAILHNLGVHSTCSSSHLGWTYSLLVNSSNISSPALPNTTLGVNVPNDADDGSGLGYTYDQVLSSAQSSALLLHLISGLPAAAGLLLLILPYRKWEHSSPFLSRFLKQGSLTMFLTFVGFVLALVAFAVDLTVAKGITDNINAISGGGGVHAVVGNLMWFALSAAVVMIPGMWSTRGQF